MDQDMMAGIFIGTVIGAALVCALLGGALALVAAIYRKAQKRTWPHG